MPMYFYAEDAPPAPPLREALAVFCRPRRPADEVPPGLVEELGPRDFTRPVGLPPEHERILAEHLELLERIERERGRLVVGESRLLVGPVGERGHRLFAVPTTTGHVGFYTIAADEPGSWSSPAPALSQGLAWHIAWRADADGTIELVASGLADDDVAGIEIRIGKDLSEVTLGQNGFLFVSREDDPVRFRGFRLRYADGSSADVGRR
jgi:hypothetical protein